MAYRPSSIPRGYTGGPSAGPTAAQTRLLTQQDEVAGFLRLAAQSKQFGDSLERLGQQTEQLVVGGRAVAEVVESWQNVFRATHLAMASLADKRSAPSAEHPVVNDLPETLVRVALSEQEQ